jgi:hypothetical protein
MPVVIIYITAGLLFIGAFKLPYGYYMFLRIVAFLVFAFAAYVAYKRQAKILPWIFGLLAILFNPIAIIHLSKGLWSVVDVVAGVFLFAVAKKIRK